jgi:hypothetical protein
MIQLLFLVKTIAFLVGIGLGWLGALWYLRTRSPLMRYIVFFALGFAFRTINQVLIFLTYMSGSSAFADLALPVAVIDLLSYLWVMLFWIAILERIGIGGNYELSGHLKYVVPAIGLVAGLALIILGRLDVLRGAVPAYRILRWLAVGSPVLSLAYLIINRGYHAEGNGLERATWLSMLLISLLVPIAIFFDEFLLHGMTISFRGHIFTPRWLGSLVLIMTCLPLMYHLLGLITRYRAAIAFIDVDRAMAGIRRRCTLSDSQDEVLRYFFERGWSEAVQFYGWSYLRQESRPVLKCLGMGGLLELLHRVQTEQTDILPLQP